ncbi:MAG: DMT family transporter [Desulfovibrio sp.]|uniref:DMT family transporter n=1 Tax=Desulfovibrio sp. 7SRBS1 TaxID=3378064 RepID=UPI003B3C1C18
MRLKGYLFVCIAATMWGLIGPVAKIAFAAGMPPLETAFWRTSIGWVFFALHAVCTRKIHVDANDMPWVGAFGVAGIAGLFGCYVVAVDHGGAALAAVLLYTAPAWVAIMSRLFFGEAITPAKLIALVVTMLGVSGVCFGPSLMDPSNETLRISPVAIVFGLLSGFSYALYYIFGKKFEGRYTSPTLFLYAMPVGAFVLAPFFKFASHPPSAWLAVIVLGLFSTYGAYLIYYMGLKHLEATRAAVVATIEPVVAAFLAYFMWNEQLSAVGYLGSILILTGVVITVLEGEHRLLKNRKKLGG